MNGLRLLGAVAGGMTAGICITALLVAGERKSGRPSELADLERAAEARLGLRVRDHGALPGPGEQAVIQGGHLLLSVAAGATYAAVTDEDSGVLSSGILFGLSFYAAMHWIVGPLLGVKKPEWQADPATIGMHTANHLLFGLATAAGARLFSRR
ncbi:hypothetical protein [Aureimonas phyllosphaerae]|uniref:DUF1440 domain-containing protein n=1 Tax=Aureimonas phyllosphaerae TaxID=1166078 RepID=A0A7W6BU93_9HYPH|nr:hypothetical protein [Aureimonas phyllosphaerae]MBB3938134.1 hypothetical protein [Aureimonas phyllosphaerae]MBB3962133.1 hypothetical protein [Aureimonas phyllosphaerae]SFF56305.1 hypothetical protein SAMN05216566_12919 [Aureimonas phyllosphaerae]